MIAAPGSGSGKTTATLALLTALIARGLRPAAFKCGPDYIDPLFHREVLGVESHNLDLFLSNADTVRALLVDHGRGRDIAVIEGVMGYYDGEGLSERAGSYDLARASQTPVLLVISAAGAALSLAALVKGFRDFRKPSGIAGLILNHCSEALYARLRPLLEAETGLPVLGYLPRLPECSVNSRHLGLVTPEEIGDLRHKLELLGHQAQQSLDIEAILALAATAPPLIASLPRITPIAACAPRIAVARDRVFCFYYADNLRVLQELGAELVFFSPLADQALPPQIGALYLGGGYPELHATQLSANWPMRESILAAIKNGLPTLAECGGFLYLHQSLDGCPLVGAIKGAAFATHKLQRFGYLTLTAERDNLLFRAGETLPAHEFHYWESNAVQEACGAAKTDGRAWPCCVASETLFAGFPHLYFYARPQIATRLVSKAAAYAAQNN